MRGSAFGWAAHFLIYGVYVMEKNNTCCFFGHRKIIVTERLKLILYNLIEDLIIKENIRIFLFGSNSEFNDLCYKAVSVLKKKYPDIKRIYVRTEAPYIEESYRDYLLEKYEDTYYPDSLYNAGRATYVKRNIEMIDKSSICVVYYNENYSVSGKSGTKIAYNYAITNAKKVFNTFISDMF